MKKNFKLKINWTQQCEGEVMVEANTLEEAIAKVGENSGFYTDLAKNMFRGYSETITIGNISCITEENHVVETVDYWSIWDGGKAITTTASYNLTTGEVFNIVPASDEESESCCRLENEYIEKKDGTVIDVFKVRNKDKYVTGKYILNLMHEAVAVHGDSCIELLRDEEDNCYVHYHDYHDSFDFGNETFEFVKERAWEDLREECQVYGYDVEEY